MEDSDQQAWQQLMHEREERLEQALQCAEAGRGSPEDWAIIRSECGLSEARWSSLVARRVHNPKVAGSNPALATQIEE